jgi:hypothetical protein
MSPPPGKLLATAFCALGWLSSFSYGLHLVGPHRHPCTAGDAFPYLVGMVAGPLTLALAAAMLGIGAGLGVSSRWPALLHLGTLAVAAWLLPAYLVNTTLEGRFICASNAAGGPLEYPTAAWQRGFVPVQNAAMVLFGSFCVWYWRRAGNAGSGEKIGTGAGA